MLVGTEEPGWGLDYWGVTSYLINQDRGHTEARDRCGGCSFVWFVLFCFAISPAFFFFVLGLGGKEHMALLCCHLPPLSL